jgi:hypothetical protein
MAPLKQNMIHAEAVEHLRNEVVGTLRLETGRLLNRPPAFFGAVRGVISDLDYVAALYAGWDGVDRRQIAIARKAIAFFRDIFSAALGDPAYGQFAEHLYGMYRVGTIHLRAPKQLRNPSASTEILSWALMEDRTEEFEYPLGSGKTCRGTHLQPIALDGQKTLLPVSIQALFEDFVKACEHFAKLLEAEAASGGTDLLTRWR